MPTDTTCMAQQFHNCLILDHEGMMTGDLGKLWDGKLIVKAKDGVVITLFKDESWYVRVDSETDPIYFISEDDEKFALNLYKLHQIEPRMAMKVADLALEWALEMADEAAAGMTNSLSRR